ncbi:MAG TPA: 30S ribosomal protein S6 [Gemmataceae bacterium]|nr:30S ribosomal protein S6 [Gemmataceae bacterium]
MPANVYECMFLLDTNKVSGDVPNAAKQLHAILERNQAQILAGRPWDERRLAYSIGKHKKGLYYLAYFNAEGKNLPALKRDFGLNEMILRHLILKVRPQMVDTMLALAKDEHALALQVIHDEPGDDAMHGGGGGRGDGPRRGGRRQDADEKEG